jgi:hypothetical protein
MSIFSLKRKNSDPVFALQVSYMVARLLTILVYVE